MVPFNLAPPMVGRLTPDYMELFDYLFSYNADEIKRNRGVSISDLAIRRGTYTTKAGDKQPCIKVYPDKTDRKTYYKFSPLYRLVGKTSVLMEEYVCGDWNTEEELGFEWEDFSSDLKDIKKFVLYAFI